MDIKIIRESAEHHFLNTIEKSKKQPQGCFVMHFAFSKKLNHSDLIASPDRIRGVIEDASKASMALCERIQKEVGGFCEGFAYPMSDTDVIGFFQAIDPRNEDMKARIKAAYDEMHKDFQEGWCDFLRLEKEAYMIQRLADAKLLSARRMEAYYLLGDTARTQSIEYRRNRRDDVVILIVEDDRFTASYTANILNKDYDVVHARNGEEAVLFYIEHAPDAVFLDIHLPGLNGNQVLETIMSIDENAYVIMLSVDSVRSNIENACKVGAHGFLKKPFSRERLLALVQKAPNIRQIQISKMT